MIFVNATAARESGSLSILNQYVTYLSQELLNEEYIIFVDYEYTYPSIHNVLFVPTDTRDWCKRLIWDYWGIKRWIVNEKIEPELTISFQNTRVNIDVPQIVYYHQSLVTAPVKWNPFVKKEFTLFMYKHFYSWFVKRGIRDNTHFVVQTLSMKDAFLEKFKINRSNISVIRPNVQNIDYDDITTINFKNDEIHLLYPATALVYKNHIQLVHALSILNNNNYSKLKRIKIHFTISETSDKVLLKQIEDYGLMNNFVFEGKLTYEKMLSFYKSCHGLLFPSYVETFGLPLIEASGAGLRVIVSDLSYARDVVGNYDGAKFVEHNNAKSWAFEIQSICDNPMKYKPITQSNENSWSKLSTLANHLKREKNT